MHDGMTMEQAGIPAATLIIPPFERLALSKRNSMGFPDYQPVIIPSVKPPVPYEPGSEELHRWAWSAYAGVFATLLGAPVAKQSFEVAAKGS